MKSEGTAMRPKMIEILKRLCREQIGQDMIEYGLLLMLVALGSVASSKSLSGTLGNTYTGIGSTITATTSGQNGGGAGNNNAGNNNAGNNNNNNNIGNNNFGNNNNNNNIGNNNFGNNNNNNNIGNNNFGNNNNNFGTITTISETITTTTSETTTITTTSRTTTITTISGTITTTTSETTITTTSETITTTLGTTTMGTTITANDGLFGLSAAKERNATSGPPPICTPEFWAGQRELGVLARRVPP